MAKTTKKAGRGRHAVPARRDRRAPAAPTGVPMPPECADGRYLDPSHRRLNVFSLDPAADVQLEMSLISRSVVSLPWERLTAGPVGEYVEVIDIDPSSGCVYDPVDLNHHSLLASDGLKPSTGNPQFHQQMVYAVAMKTILNFEQVLGRRVMWSERTRDENDRYLRTAEERFVPRLRIYPHALREQNAYYSPTKKALLFGYFHAPTADPRDEMPGGVVFSCLSHDIIAHETTHAILDGMHRRLLDASNVDMLAFHEAFADIVAIFQHFTLPGLLLDQIQRTRGNLRNNNLLAQLASQFARSTGRGGALRNALGHFDAEGRRKPPDPARLGRTFEPHDRGAILVAAVFDAFLRIYENRAADLRRIATGGTGVLGEGEIHPDLARRFAQEAVESAQRVLNICIRAVDYLPPVDVTFGDYLRALITADTDFFPDDRKRYRLAFIESFRDHGIYPHDVRTLAEDALRWTPMGTDANRELCELLPPVEVLRTMALSYEAPSGLRAMLGDEEEEEEASLGAEIWESFRDNNPAGAVKKFLSAAWLQPGQSNGRPNARNNGTPAPQSSRFLQFQGERLFARFLHGWIHHQARRTRGLSPIDVGWHFGLDIEKLQAGGGDRLRLEVHAVRPTLRLRPDGRSKVELLVMLTQRERRNLPRDDDENDPVVVNDEILTFKFRGGSTVIIDPEEGCVRYAISKNLRRRERFLRHAAFLRSQLEEHGSAAIERFGLTRKAEGVQRRLEPFALLHENHQPPGGY